MARIRDTKDRRASDVLALLVWLSSFSDAAAFMRCGRHEETYAGFVALAEQFGLPVHAVGVGEKASDLRPFDAEAFARGLVGVG